MEDEKSARMILITFTFSHSATSNCFNPTPSILLPFANPDIASFPSQRRNGVLYVRERTEDGLDNSKREARRRYYVLFKKTDYGG